MIGTDMLKAGCPSCGSTISVKTRIVKFGSFRKFKNTSHVHSVTQLDAFWMNFQFQMWDYRCYKLQKLCRNAQGIITLGKDWQQSRKLQMVKITQCNVLPTRNCYQQLSYSCQWRNNKIIKRTTNNCCGYHCHFFYYFQLWFTAISFPE